MALWTRESEGHQHGDGVTSSYFGTNEAAGPSTSATAGAPHAEGSAAAGPTETNGATTAPPPGYGIPMDSNATMSPIQHVWSGPPASTWSSMPSRLFGTTPPQGVHPGGPVHGGLPPQAFGGLGMADYGQSFGPYGMGVYGMTPLRPALPHQALHGGCGGLPQQALPGGCGGLPQQALPGGCGVLPQQALPGGCGAVHQPASSGGYGPQPHQVPSAVFQQAPNGMTGNGVPGFGQNLQANGIGSGGNSPLAGMSPPVAGSPDRHGPRAQPGDPWCNYRPTETVTNAKEFSQRLREERPGFKPVTSAFEAMGKTTPSSTAPHGANVTNEQLLAKLVDAVSGDRKLPIPTWDRTPSGLRGWLRQLSFWETESNLPKEKWGVRLFQSLSGEARKIAETVSTEVLLTSDGYSAVLTSLMQKFQPYLDAVGPLSIDTFLYSGERAPRETFNAYLSRKSTQKQELESQIGAEVHPLIAGRVLLRQAGLTENQQQLVALKNHTLLSYDEVAKTLQPLDRLDTLAKAGALSTGTTGKVYMQATGEDDEDEEHYDEEAEEELETEDEDSDFIQFEDKEYDETEAVYVQAYNDVRKDLRSRRKERGFVKHGRRSPSGSSSPKKGRGKGRGKKGDRKKSTGKQQKDEPYIRGTESELLARTRCFSCQELGHVSRNCPHRSTTTTATPKKTFVAVTPTGHSTTTSYAVFKHECQYPPKEEALLRAVYAGVQVRGFEAVIDTAAEQCIIGSKAFASLQEELALLNLRVVPIRQPAVPCDGIGGRAKLQGLYDVPTCIAGLLGVLRFTVITDTLSFVTPPLLGVSYLEAIGAIIGLSTNHYSTPDGHTANMRRLSSGHRAIHMLDFDTTPWKLPLQHQVRGHDPFRLPVPRSSHYFSGGNGAEGFGDLHVSCEADAGSPMDETFFQMYLESQVLPLESGELTATPVASAASRPDRSRSPTRTNASERNTMADDENNQGLGAGATTTRRVTFDTTTASGAPADVASSAAPTSPMTSPEPAEEPGAGGGASATPTPTDANLPETQEEWPAEEAPSSLSKETDPPVDPFDEVSSPEFVMHDGQVLDPNVETKVWVIKTNSDKELLATYVGWRVRILDPFDVPQARRYDLTERRQVVAMFPQNESRVVRDCWPTNINRIMEKPWYGDITFYESHEKGDPFRPFGTWLDAQPRGYPRPPPGPPPGFGSTSSSSRPSGTSGSSGGGAGHYTHQYGGHAASAQQNSAAQLMMVEYKMDATDGDGNWHEICEMDAGDVDEPHRHDCSAVESSSRGESSKAGEVFQLSMLKNCLRRRRPLSTRSPIAQLMSWTFSKAAQTFLHRLQRCNGAQEEPVERSCKQPSGLHPLHDGQGGQGRGIESKAWDSEVRDSLVSRGESYDAADPHDALADGSGLPAEEGGGVRRGGHRER